MEKKLNPMLATDQYKIGHVNQYPAGTTKVYSTWTARASRIQGIDKVVVFGLQAFVKKYLMSYFNENFFSRPEEEVVTEYARTIKATLGMQTPKTDHIRDLHKLGYLPISIKALPEGTLAPIRTPQMTIENTDPKFFWLTNYLETLASCELWNPSTSATVAYKARSILEKYAKETSDDLAFVDFQGHNFSMRGMSSLESSAATDAGHLLSFVGSDTIPGVNYAENYYNANIENEFISCSVPATEHSVACASGEDELATFKRLITEVYPNGIVSVVSDTWDFWNVIGNVLPALKNEIMARKGGPVGDKLVIRPDSGDPVKILTGDENATTELERKGLIEALWDTFGGTTNSKGFKVLDSHIGAIYGDAITLERLEEISERLKNKGFASTNAVYGLGSFLYQYNTRDTFGYALKSTHVIINGDEKQIFKDPKTDNGIKKSQKGMVAVYRDSNDDLKWMDGLMTNQRVQGDLLTEVFRDGKLLVDENFKDIRARLAAHRNK